MRLNLKGRAALCGLADGGLVTCAVLAFLCLDAPGTSFMHYLHSPWWFSALFILFVVVAVAGYWDARAQLSGDGSWARSIGRGVAAGLSLAVAANVFMAMPSVVLAVETAGYPFTLDASGHQVMDWASVGEYLAITLAAGIVLGAVFAVLLSWANRLLLRLLPG